MSPPSRTGPGGSVEPITTNKKVYNLEQVYLNIGDQHSQILSNINLNLLDPSGLQNKATIFRLSLITAFQFAETLPDAPAAEATRTRKDWIYALHLPVSHSSITAIDLCQLREALLTSPQSLKEFGRLLDSLGKIGLYAKEVKGTLDAAELITEVCRITRFDDLMHSMKMALDLLTATQLEWLCTDHPSFSYKRYQSWMSHPKRLPAGADLKSEAAGVGKDILHLLVGLNEQRLFPIAERVEIQQISRLLRNEFVWNVDQMCWRDPACAACKYSRAGCQAIKNC